MRERQSKFKSGKPAKPGKQDQQKPAKYNPRGSAKFSPKSAKYDTSEKAKYPPKSAKYGKPEQAKYPPQASAKYGKPEQAKYPPQASAKYGKPEQAKYPPQASAKYGNPEQPKYPPQASAKYGKPGQAKYPPQASAKYGKSDQAKYPPKASVKYGNPEQAKDPPKASVKYGNPEQAKYPPRASAKYGKPEQAKYPPQASAKYGNPEQAKFPPRASAKYGNPEQAKYPPQASAKYGKSEQAKCPPQASAKYGKSDQAKYPPQASVKYGKPEQAKYPPQASAKYGNPEPLKYSPRRPADGDSGERRKYAPKSPQKSSKKAVPHDQGKQKTLDRVLSKAGVGSRAEARQWIAGGRVFVNGGKITDPDFWVDSARDKVLFDGRPLEAKANLYLLLNKPKGYLTTHKDPEGRPTIYDLLKDIDEWVFPVGRLDQDTSGLLMITNDGAFGDLVTNPESKMPKTYLVKCSQLLSDEQLGKLREGLELADGPTRPAVVTRIRDSSKYTFFEITITEGRNRQVRRMVEALEAKVLKLVRTQIGAIELQGLEMGKYRALTAAEVAILKAKPRGPKPKPTGQTESET